MAKDNVTKTALFMAPMARKKTVTEKYVPNSYRVISQDAEKSWLKPQPHTRASFRTREDGNILGQNTSIAPSVEYRHNKPNPNHVSFLRQDVRLLNEPVCDVHTTVTKDEQHIWWNHHPSKESPSVAQHTLDTTVRNDFQYQGQSLKGSSRHSSNPNSVPAHGCVPVTMMKKPDGKQRILKEGISYEHQYNSRLDPSYPIRGKRHGNFVWDEFPPKQVDQMLHHYGIVSDTKSQTVGVENTKPSSTPVQAQSQETKTEKVPTTTLPILPPIGAL